MPNKLRAPAIEKIRESKDKNLRNNRIGLREKRKGIRMPNKLKGQAIEKKREPKDKSDLDSGKGINDKG